MGVHFKNETEGDAALEMHCSECESDFWTDETMVNDCPDCGHVSMTPA